MLLLLFIIRVGEVNMYEIDLSTCEDVHREPFLFATFQYQGE